MPRQCEDFIRNVFTYFSHSAKRKFEFRQFQELLELKPHKILHPCQTRWLSLHQAISRVLEQRVALKEYFTKKEVEEKLRAIDFILKDMNDPSIFLYLNFLNFILPTFNSLNLMFQRKSPTIHLIYCELNMLYKTLLLYFCKKEQVDKGNIASFDPTLECNHIPIGNKYLGASVHGLLQKEEYRNQHIVNDVKYRCKIFMIKMCQELKNRFTLNEPLWYICSFLSPSKVLDKNTRNKIPTLLPLLLTTNSPHL